MTEIWKDVKGFEALYQVSNYGRVRSLPRKVKCRTLKGVMLKLIEKKSTGYYAVSLHPKSKPVLQLALDGTLVRKWKCASDAVRECGFDSGSITRCCKNEYKTHKGYLWRYDI